VRLQLDPRHPRVQLAGPDALAAPARDGRACAGVRGGVAGGGPRTQRARAAGGARGGRGRQVRGAPLWLLPVERPDVCPVGATGSVSVPVSVLVSVPVSVLVSVPVLVLVSVLVSVPVSVLV
jgi:hypothetical protein